MTEKIFESLVKLLTYKKGVKNQRLNQILLKKILKKENINFDVFYNFLLEKELITASRGTLSNSNTKERVKSLLSSFWMPSIHKEVIPELAIIQNSSFSIFWEEVSETEVQEKPSSENTIKPSEEVKITSDWILDLISEEKNITPIIDRIIETTDEITIKESSDTWLFNKTETVSNIWLFNEETSEEMIVTKNKETINLNEVFTEEKEEIPIEVQETIVISESEKNNDSLINQQEDLTSIVAKLDITEEENKLDTIREEVEISEKSKNQENITTISEDSVYIEDIEESQKFSENTTQIEETETIQETTKSPELTVSHIEPIENIEDFWVNNDIDFLNEISTTPIEQEDKVKTNFFSMFTLLDYIIWVIVFWIWITISYFFL